MGNNFISHPRYKILLDTHHKIGEGNHSKVFKIKDKNNKQRFAAKIISLD